MQNYLGSARATIRFMLLRMCLRDFDRSSSWILPAGSFSTLYNKTGKLRSQQRRAVHSCGGLSCQARPLGGSSIVIVVKLFSWNRLMIRYLQVMLSVFSCLHVWTLMTCWCCNWQVFANNHWYAVMSNWSLVGLQPLSRFYDWPSKSCLYANQSESLNCCQVGCCRSPPADNR